jgi:regulator of replication initiation timing
VVGWKNVGQLRAENERLRAELESIKAQTAAASEADTRQRDQELQRLRTDAQEVVRLRGEVTQLRNGAKDSDKLRAENQRLQAENQQLRVTAGTASAANPPATTASKDQFPKESWTFTGYATPEAALVSAIWSMKEGNSKSYAASLTPEEQARLAQAWANKSEPEIAAKHQQDVSAITGLRVLDRQTVSPEEIQMNVYIEGVGRLEKVSMKRIGEEWKFGGFIRNASK